MRTIFFNAFDEKVRELFNEDKEKYLVLSWIIFKTNYQGEYSGLKNRECYFSFSVLEKELNIDVTKLKRIVKALESKGFIEWECKSKSRYKPSILCLKSEPVNEPVNEPVSEPVNEPVKPSNTNVLNGVSEPVSELVDEPVSEPSSKNISKNKSNNNNKKEKGYDEIINNYTRDTELKCTILEFIKMRKAIKKPMTDRALKLLLKNLDKLSEDDNSKIDILNQSILNSWQGVFPIKNYNEIKQESNKQKEVRRYPSIDFNY